MDEEKLKEMIRNAVQPDGRLTCEDAQRVARQANVPPGRVGRLADEMKIKIKGCQLGCF